MRAVISGQAGLATVESGAELLLLSVESPGQPVPIHPDAVASIFRGATDTFSTEVDDAAAARELLSTAWKRDRLLQMLIILLRGDANWDVRALAAEAAEELIVSPEARRFALDRLHSKPLPGDADLPMAMTIARARSAGEIAEVLRELGGSREREAAAGEAPELWTKSLPDVERIVAATVQRYGFDADDADRLRAIVDARLAENDYTVLRAYGEGDISLYLTAVIQRIAVKFRRDLSEDVIFETRGRLMQRVWAVLSEVGGELRHPGRLRLWLCVRETMTFPEIARMFRRRQWRVERLIKRGLEQFRSVLWRRGMAREAADPYLIFDRKTESAVRPIP